MKRCFSDYSAFTITLLSLIYFTPSIRAIERLKISNQTPSSLGGDQGKKIKGSLGRNSSLNEEGASTRRANQFINTGQDLKDPRRDPNLNQPKPDSEAGIPPPSERSNSKQRTLPLIDYPLPQSSPHSLPVSPQQGTDRMPTDKMPKE